MPNESKNDWKNRAEATLEKLTAALVIARDGGNEQAIHGAEESLAAGRTDLDVVHQFGPAYL